MFKVQIQNIVDLKIENFDKVDKIKTEISESGHIWITILEESST